jgi:hypothetical protein
MQQVPPKCWPFSDSLHGIMSQKTVFFRVNRSENNDCNMSLIPIISCITFIPLFHFPPVEIQLGGGGVEEEGKKKAKIQLSL